MENRGVVEMAVVCSDLSLLENINSLLKQKGVIAVEDEAGTLHYIVDGRSNRQSVAGKVTAINPSGNASNEKEEAYLEICIKTVLREYGFDMSLIGTVLIYKSILMSFKKRIPLPATMKVLYCETGRELGLSYEQSERDVRYAIVKSSLKKMRSRAAIRCIQSRIERRLGYRDPLE
ncbi:MAG: hypothetical protein K6E72_10335 [Saccharofermentans sp.]|nr:hypothetical protein [Saccharofermentans sp.]